MAKSVYYFKFQMLKVHKNRHRKYFFVVIVAVYDDDDDDDDDDYDDDDDDDDDGSLIKLKARWWCLLSTFRISLRTLIEDHRFDSARGVSALMSCCFLRHQTIPYTVISIQMYQWVTVKN